MTATRRARGVSLRAGNAKKEMAKTSVRGFFHKVIVNDNLERAYVELKAVIDEEILNGDNRRRAGGSSSVVGAVLESLGFSSSTVVTYQQVATVVAIAGVAVGTAAYYRQRR